MQKYLIVGLGNIGEKYRYTRHNIGFLAVDELVKQLDQSFVSSNFGEVAQFKYKARQVTVLKPNTYMDISGDGVRVSMQKQTIAIEHNVLNTDDINLPSATIRFIAKARDCGHTGLKDIHNRLHNQNHPRLKFGVDNGPQSGTHIDYVLGT